MTAKQTRFPGVRIVVVVGKFGGGLVNLMRPESRYARNVADLSEGMESFYENKGALWPGELNVSSLEGELSARIKRKIRVRAFVVVMKIRTDAIDAKFAEKLSSSRWTAFRQAFVTRALVDVSSRGARQVSGPVGSARICRLSR
jgi:hypothetical protein